MHAGNPKQAIYDPDRVSNFCQINGYIHLTENRAPYPITSISQASSLIDLYLNTAAFLEWECTDSGTLTSSPNDKPVNK